jgi:hypothetical protein
MGSRGGAAGSAGFHAPNERWVLVWASVRRGQHGRMGSFSQIVLGFEFQPDTPDHVLAAFSALTVPSGPDLYGNPPPPLPEPFDPDPERLAWSPEIEAFDPAEDPEPWRHGWAGWLSQSMGVQYTPASQMVWSQTGRWTVSCRWGMKWHWTSLLPWLAWLGPFLERYERVPRLLGYIEFEYDERPTLVWLTPDGRIVGEDLN